MVTIRASVYPDDRQSRDRITAPAVEAIARRSSARLVRDACAACRAALAASLPSDGAHALIEVTGRHGMRVVAEYDGVPTRRDQST